MIRRVLTSDVRELGRNSAYIFAGSTVVGLCIFLRSILIARFAGLELFGAFMIFVAAVEVTLEWCNLNLDAALVKFGTEAKARDDMRALRNLLRLAYACTAATLVVGISGLGVFFAVRPTSLPDGMTITSWMAALFAMGRGIEMFDRLSASLLRIYDRVGTWSRIRASFAAIDLAVVFALCLSAGSFRIWIWVYVFCLILLAALRQGVMAWHMCRCMQQGSEARSEPTEIPYRRVFTFAIHNSLSRTIKTFYSYVDVLILGACSTPVAVALYSTAKKMLAPLSLITGPMAVAVYPQMANLLARERTRELRKLLGTATLAVTGISAVAFGIMYWFGEPLIELAFGQEFREAARPMRIILVGYLLGYGTFWLVPLLQASGRTRMRLQVDIVNVIICLALSLILVPRYGEIGASIVLLCAYVFSCTTLTFGMRDLLFRPKAGPSLVEEPPRMATETEASI